MTAPTSSPPIASGPALERRADRRRREQHRGPAGRQPPAQEPDPTTAAGRRWPEALAVAAGLLVWGWQVGTPSPWRDEADTLIVSRRGIGDIVTVVRRVDLVHAAFYLVAHLVLEAVSPFVTGVGAQVVAVRLISVVAMAATAGLLVSTGRALGSVELGLTAAAALIASPLATRWGQDARPFPVATLLATAATRVLIAGVARPRRRGPWAGYALTLCLLGVDDVLALLIVAAHATFLLLGRPSGVLRRWSVATAAAGLVLGPFALLTFGQRGQVSWLTPPHLYDFTAYYILAFGTKALPPLLILAAAGTVVVARGLPPGPAGQALRLGAAWATVPPVLVWTVSQRVPMWTVHYVLFCLPGLALLVGAVVTALSAAVARRARPDLPVAGVAGALVLAGLALVALPAQVGYRDPSTGHGEDVRGVARYVATHAVRGDAVLFVPYDLRDLRTLYPESFAALDDVMLATSPVASGTISGVDRDPTQLATALAGRRTVWLVSAGFGEFTTAREQDRRKLDALKAGYRPVARAQLSVFVVTRYEATGAGGAPGSPVPGTASAKASATAPGPA